MSTDSNFPRLARPPLGVSIAAAAGNDDPLGPPAPPEVLRRRYDQLNGQRIRLRSDQQRVTSLLAALTEYLAVAPQVEAALEVLGQELFGRLAGVIERHLTLALQEVLQQPITLKVERDFKRGAATMRFHIQRDGQEEDIMRGQGGSVANILSVGLRIFALAQLDSKTHRRFLILDEQDCWLAPDLVPRLVKIIHEAAKALNFQVILISHHAVPCFAPYADKILRLVPTAQGVEIEDATPKSSHPDGV
jgi:DNA repair exonuclease SbcCD ATPase subunit